MNTDKPDDKPLIKYVCETNPTINTELFRSIGLRYQLMANPSEPMRVIWIDSESNIRDLPQLLRTYRLIEPPKAQDVTSTPTRQQRLRKQFDPKSNHGQRPHGRKYR
jgi:hypothetical protein